jgi:hypothetical protein
MARRALDGFRALLAHPSARFLRDVTIGDIGARDQAYDLFAAALPSTVRSISVGDHGRPRNQTSYMWREISLPPRVEELRLECLVGKLVAFPSERLRTLAFGDEFFSPMAELEKIPVFPSLEELRFTAKDLGFRCALLDPARVPRLRKLTVHEAGDTVAMVLAASKLLGQLDEVTLRGKIDDHGAEQLAAAPDLDHLKILDLGGNKIDEVVLDRKLRGRPFELRAGGQRWSPTGE